MAKKEKKSCESKKDGKKKQCKDGARKEKKPKKAGSVKKDGKKAKAMPSLSVCPCCSKRCPLSRPRCSKGRKLASKLGI